MATDSPPELTDVLDVLMKRLSDVVPGDVVLPLLSVVQANTGTDTETTALLCLHSLFEIGAGVAGEAGWEAVRKGPTAGSRVWRHNADPATDTQSPVIAPGVDLLLQLPLLYTPGEDADGQLVWQLKVVYASCGPSTALHRVLTSPPSTGSSSPPIHVVDVVQHDTNDDSAVVVVRQVWVGTTWRGLANEPPAASVMSLPPWKIDSWSAITMAGIASLLASSSPCSSSPPRVLVAGVGACPTVSFLAHNCPSIELEAVLPSAEALEVGRKYMGAPFSCGPSTTPYVGPGSQAPPSFSHPTRGSRQLKPVRRGATLESYDGSGAGMTTCTAHVSAALDPSTPASSFCAVLIHNADVLTPAVMRWLTDAEPSTGTSTSVPVCVCTTFDRAAGVRDALSTGYSSDAVTTFMECRMRDDFSGDHHAEHVVVVAGVDVSTGAWAGAASPTSAIVSLPVSEAQRTAVVRTPQFLSRKDIATILEVGHSSPEASSAGSETRSHDSDAWKVRFLQTNGLIGKHLPDVARRVEALVRAVDRDHYRLIKSSDEPLNIRCAELHRQVAPSPGLVDPKHFDQDSLYTVDIMLSEDGSFGGGEFNTLEPDGTTKVHEFNMGDAAVFVSHKYHSVRPVTEGLRQVLVVEFWRGPSRSCGHRCGVLRGPCPLDRMGALAGAGRDVGGGGGGGEADSLLSQLPFKLGSSEDSVVAGYGSVRRLLWQENASAAQPKVEFVGKEDDVWDLFD